MFSQDKIQHDQPLPW